MKKTFHVAEVFSFLSNGPFKPIEQPEFTASRWAALMDHVTNGINCEQLRPNAMHPTARVTKDHLLAVLPAGAKDTVTTFPWDQAHKLAADLGITDTNSPDYFSRVIEPVYINLAASMGLGTEIEIPKPDPATLKATAPAQKKQKTRRPHIY